MKRWLYISGVVFLSMGLWACPKKQAAWFCTDNGLYYEYRAVVPISVSPNQSVYHVGDTVTFQAFWPSTFTDSLSQISFSFNDQEKVLPELHIAYLEDDYLYPGNGVDTTFDLNATMGQATEAFFGGYPYYKVHFAPVDSGLFVSYRVVFHVPGKYLHSIEETTFGEIRSWEGIYCIQGETADFCFRIQGDDHYSSLFPPPPPYGLGEIFYTSYDYYRNAGGFVFNVVP